MVDWDLVSKIRRSPNKRRILELLKNSEALTPTDIAENLEIHRNNVSEHLSFLQEEGLVNCENPDAPHHRYYSITDRGGKLIDKLD